MAVFTDPIDFISLVGTDGLGLLVGIRDDTTDLTGRKNAVNAEYIELARIKGFWRLRSFDYTSSSTPALVAGTRAYNTPTTSGAVFDMAFRLYYRQAGVMTDVEIVSDSEWLERSAVRAADAGYPRYARIVQTAVATTQIEFERPVSASFITTIGTITLEYFIRIVQLSANTDVPILPGNLRPLILPGAAYRYALSQGDFALADRMKPDAVLAKAEVLRYDLTRTGRPRKVRPTNDYLPAGAGGRGDYGEVR